jgi:hypothetical protein
LWVLIGASCNPTTRASVSAISSASSVAFFEASAGKSLLVGGFSSKDASPYSCGILLLITPNLPSQRRLSDANAVMC